MQNFPGNPVLQNSILLTRARAVDFTESFQSSVHFAIPSGKRFPASRNPQLILTQYKSDFIIFSSDSDGITQNASHPGADASRDLTTFVVEEWRRNTFSLYFLQNPFQPGRQSTQVPIYSFICFFPSCIFIIEFYSFFSDVVSINTSALAPSLAAASETQNVLLSPPTYIAHCGKLQICVQKTYLW